MITNTTLVSPAGGMPGRFGRRWVMSQPVARRNAPSAPAPFKNSPRVSAVFLVVFVLVFFILPFLASFSIPPKELSRATCTSPRWVEHQPRPCPCWEVLNYLTLSTDYTSLHLCTNF